MKIFAQNCLIGDRFAPAMLEVRDGIIAGVEVRGLQPGDHDFLEFADGFLAPGLIDLQINGVAGVDFTECTSDQALVALKELASYGTTALCPTVITSAKKQIARQVQTISDLPSVSGVSRNLGVHLEGPVISAIRRGAHDPAFLLTPEEFLSSEIDLERLRIITVAPELDGAEELIKRASALGVIVSLGHSDATAEVAVEASKAGATMVTHLFNGMREIHQREPGIAVATMASDSLNFGMIVDGEHVNFELVRLMQKIASSRMIVVSDASAALRAQPGAEFQLGGSKVVVDLTGTARRIDGTLASSGLTQLEAIEKAVQNGLDRAKLINSASRIPANAIGETMLGRIEVGAHADLIHYTVNTKPEIDYVMIGGAECQF